MDKKFLGLHGLEETREFSKLKNINSKFAKENCYNILMKIIPGLIENDFDPFVTTNPPLTWQLAQTFLKIVAPSLKLEANVYLLVREIWKKTIKITNEIINFNLNKNFINELNTNS